MTEPLHSMLYVSAAFQPLAYRLIEMLCSATRAAHARLGYPLENHGVAVPDMIYIDWVLTTSLWMPTLQR